MKFVVFDDQSIIQFNQIETDSVVELPEPVSENSTTMGESVYSGELASLQMNCFDSEGHLEAIEELKTSAKKVQFIIIGSPYNVMWNEATLINSIRHLPSSPGQRQKIAIVCRISGVDLDISAKINLADYLISNEMIFPVANQLVTVSAVTTGITIKQYSRDNTEIDSITSNDQNGGRCVAQTTTIAGVYKLKIYTNGHSQLAIRTDSKTAYTSL